MTSDASQLERIIHEHGFYVDTRLEKSKETGHWVTSHPEHVVVDDVRHLHQTSVHPAFTDPSNNAVFHSLAEVTHVLTQLQVR